MVIGNRYNCGGRGRREEGGDATTLTTSITKTALVENYLVVQFSDSQMSSPWSSHQQAGQDSSYGLGHHAALAVFC